VTSQASWGLLGVLLAFLGGVLFGDSPGAVMVIATLRVKREHTNQTITHAPQHSSKNNQKYTLNNSTREEATKNNQETTKTIPNCKKAPPVARRRRPAEAFFDNLGLFFLLFFVAP
jgi:hypothetical protein